MEVNSSRCVNNKILTATILPRGEAEFECGLVIAAKEIQWIVGSTRIIRPGDRVSFTINNITVSRHEHKFQCSCGLLHISGEKHEPTR